MTCIVGLVHEGVAYIGADSAGVGGLDITIRADRKVFKNGEFLMGFTASFRMGQLLRHAFTPPYRRHDVELEKYMVTEFVDAVRSCLKTGGFAAKNSEVERGGDFIVGHAGRLFTIESDYQVGEPTREYAATGCGYAYALGSLHSTRGQKPEDRIRAALEAAADGSAGVAPPFHIESIGVAK